VPLLRNADKAIIDPAKLRDFVTNPRHKDNDGRWRLFAALGYSQSNWEQLELDIREQHLSQEATFSRATAFGDFYEVIAMLVGPRGSATITTVWQYEPGSDVPRFVTAYGG
jgi:hypothetical protein